MSQVAYTQSVRRLNIATKLTQSLNILVPQLIMSIYNMNTVFGTHLQNLPVKYVLEKRFSFTINFDFDFFFFCNFFMGGTAS